MKLICILITGAIIGFGLDWLGYNVDTIIYWIAMPSLNINQVIVWNKIFSNSYQ